ncbi:MAG: DNA topoisomerase IV subunit A, partial [Alphaproteobacteria bacterium]|nr:DNA topoisomerase IV subunit A [Alphaproteobacteria bacterium]
DEDAVDFRPTYDGLDEEPVVLPAGFPNLLANGSSGIAVGMATSIPPHNAGELIDACLALIKDPDLSTSDLLALAPGPDFPTGGVIVEPRASLAEVYETGRGGVRLRARWEKEDAGRGLWRIVVTEVPYQVKKADLVEQLASLLEDKKVPLLGDVRDESAEDVRLVLEPRSRTVEPEVLMESLFKLSDLEVRVPVNMNVLNARGAPEVMGLKAALRAYLDHRREVVVRRAQFRLARIERRLHVLDGLLIVFLNLDEVIRIVRYEDEPRVRLIAAFALSEVQADAVLDTRLRQLAKLEEAQIRAEHTQLSLERDELNAVVATPQKQWRRVAEGLAEARKLLGDKAGLGPRRSSFGEAPNIDLAQAVEARVVREAITVIVSERGWIRAAKGRVEDPASLTFKEGDRLAFAVAAETTDRLMLFASDGRVFTLPCDKLPSARGQGEPLRLMIELGEQERVLSVFAHRPGARRIVASAAGYGFIFEESEAIAAKRSGKQVLNLSDGTAAAVCLEVKGDQVAVIGDNGKILIFSVDELPVMARGKGVKLQSYREGGLRDAMTFGEEEGASWVDSGGRTRSWPEWRDWAGRRGSAGKAAPRGFAANRRFRP